MSRRGKTAKQRQRAQTMLALGVPPGPFAGVYARALEQAKEVGLYLLHEGTGHDPSWRVYHAKTGKHLMTYSPRTRRWVGSGKSGVADTPRHVIDVALVLATFTA
jgi:hypothetical protein